MDFFRSFFSSAKARFFLWALGVLMLILLLLPIAIKYYLEYAIKDYGIGDAQIVDVDLDLFAGTFELENLELNQGGEVTLVLGRVFLNYGWFGLGLTELEVEEFTLENSRLVIYQDEQGHWYVIVPLNTDEQSQPDTPADTEEKAVKLPKILAQAINFNNVELVVRSEKINGVFTIDTFRLNRLSSFSDEPAFLKLDADWNGARIEFDWTAEIIKDIPRLEGDVRISNVQFAELLPLLGEPFSKIDGVADIALQVKAKRVPEQGLSVAGDGSIIVKNLAVDYQQFDVSIETFKWQGQAALDVDNPLETFQHKADILVSGIKLDVPEKNLGLVNIQQITLTNIVVEGVQQIALDSMQLETFDILRTEQAKQADFRMAALLVDKITLTEQRKLELGSIAINDGQYHIVMDKKGELQAQSTLQQILPPPTENEAVKAEENTGESATEAAFSVKLDHFEMTGDSYIAFEDRKFDPIAKAIFSVDTLEVDDLDQQAPDNKTQLKLLGHLDEFSKIAIDGWTHPFASHKNTALEGSLNAIELPPFSPYIEAATGYHINSGQLDHDFSLQVEQEVITMSNAVELRGFELEEMDAAKSADVSKSMGVSLGFGLDLMRDGDGTIELDVPVNGRLDDPSLSLGSVISTALGQAITKGSLTFLKYAIQPYGAIVLAGEQLSKQMSSLDLESVAFPATVDILPADQQDYLDKLIDLMQQRPGISLTLCGSASLADEQAFTDSGQVFDESSLNQLASTRSIVVKRYFVERQVESARLSLCKPRVHDELLNGVQVSL